MAQLRPGVSADADELTALFLASRAAALPYLPQVHTDSETRWWMEHVVLTDQTVCVAGEAHAIEGFAAVAAGWLHHLYLRPERRRRGIGTALLEWAKDTSPVGLRLFVFQRNEAAIAFYERHGFTEIEHSDGSTNEEREPDLLMRWQPLAT